MTNNNYVKVTPATERSGTKFLPLINAIVEAIEENISEFETSYFCFFSTIFDYSQICHIVEKLGLSSLWDESENLKGVILKEVCYTFRYNGYDTKLHSHFDANGNKHYDFIEVALPGRLSYPSKDNFDGTNWEYLKYLESKKDFEDVIYKNHYDEILYHNSE